MEMHVSPRNAPNITCPTATFQAPIESTNASAATAQDFSAILTEMIGFGPTLPLSSAPRLTAAAVDSTNSLAPSTPGIKAQQPEFIGVAAAPLSSSNAGANDVSAQETAKLQE